MERVDDDEDGMAARESIFFTGWNQNSVPGGVLNIFICVALILISLVLVAMALKELENDSTPTCFEQLSFG